VAAYDRWVLRTLALDADELLRGRVWQVLTYMFLHSLDGWGHLLSNAIGFYFIGGALEQRIGTRALLRVSLGAGLAGAAAVLLVQFTGVVTGAWEPRPVLGASGAVSGLLGAFCFLFWDEWLLLFFIRLRGKHLFWLIVAVDAARGLSSIFGSGNVAVHCHFGGLLFGVAWVSGWWPPRNVGLRLKRAWLARKLRVIEGGRSTKEERTIH
jgi:membrane associated rhomboid family serine protease